MTLNIDLNDLTSEHPHNDYQINLPYEVMFAKADSNQLIDIKGKKYIDFTSNADNISLGHDHFIIKSIFNARRDYPLCYSRYFYGDIAFSLIKKVAELTNLDTVYLSNSSLEAADTAYKLVRLWADKLNCTANKNELIMFKGSSVSQNLNVYTLTNVPDNNNSIIPAGLSYKTSYMAGISSLKNIISKNTAAIVFNPFDMLEGSYIIDHEILRVAKNLCEKNDLALIFDLSSISPGRTGSLLPEFPVEPDIIILSNGFAQGIPIGITAVSERLSSQSYQHMYGVSSLACRIASDMIDFLHEVNIQEKINNSAQYLLKTLQKIQDKYLNVLEINSKGMLATIEMDFNLSEFVERCLNDGVIVELIDSNLIKLTPPFTITEEELDVLFEIFDKHLGKLKSDYKMQ